MKGISSIKIIIIKYTADGQSARLKVCFVLIAFMVLDLQVAAEGE